MDEVRRVWSVGEISEVAGLTTAYVRQLLLAGKIQGIKCGSSRRGFWEVPDQEVRRWLEDRGVEVGD